MRDSNVSNISRTNEYFFKFLLIGDPGVGKTSILKRYIENEFSGEHQPTIGAEFGSKLIELEDNTKIKLQIWDAAGQDSFLTVIKSFYRDAQCIFLVYNVQEQTFENLKRWNEEINDNSDPGVIRILIGNQVDGPDRQVEYDESVDFMKDNGIHFFFETSALEGTNIDLAFIEAAKLAFLFYMKERGEGGGSLFSARKKSSVSLSYDKMENKHGGLNCSC